MVLNHVSRAKGGGGAGICQRYHGLDEKRAVLEACSKRKPHLRKVSARTIHGLWHAIGRFLTFDILDGCANNSSRCGCDPT